MTIFESIRQLLSQGDTAQALRLLITHLEKEKSNPAILRTLRVLESNFNTARNKEIKGILDFSEAQQVYSKTTDALVSITEDLASGREPLLEVEAESPSKARIYWLIGGGILLLLGLIAGILLNKNKRHVLPPPVVEKPVVECPEFDKSGITVMLIPFENLGDGNSKPEIALQTLIRDLTQKNNVKSDIQIFQGTRFLNNPPSIEDAMKIGRRCDAKMVIWGQFEKIQEGISLDVRYTFTEAANIPGGVIADTFRNLSELKTDRAKFTSLEDAVFTLCTFMALHEGNIALAEKWLNKVKNPSPRAKKIKEMLKTH